MLTYRPGFGPDGLLGPQAPAIEPPPILQREHVTFGSFNAVSKLSETTIGIWARLLRAVPGSRLVLKAWETDSAEVQVQLRAKFDRHGVRPQQLDILPREQEPLAHLRRYAEMDIALDTIPYNGVTTTFEAIWMGVPVMVLEGDTVPGRMGVTIAKNLGHPEWIAHSAEEYVQNAAALAANKERIVRLRAELRPRLQASALMDMNGFTRNLERIYREIWRNWCGRSLAVKRR